MIYSLSPQYYISIFSQNIDNEQHNNGPCIFLNFPKIVNVGYKGRRVFSIH